MMGTKRIVICGSMSFYGQMMNVNKRLAKHNIPSILPSDDDEVAFKMSAEQFEDYKRRVSFQYLKKIRRLDTWGILVINPDKHGIYNYIGPNSFAEIAVAFANKKKVYLMYGIPDGYQDELNAWRILSLDGSMEKIIADYKKVSWKEKSQLTLFPEFL